MRTWLALIVAPSLALGCLSVNYALVSLVPVCVAANAAINGVSVASLVVCAVTTAFGMVTSSRRGVLTFVDRMPICRTVPSTSPILT